MSLINLIRKAKQLEKEVQLLGTGRKCHHFRIKDVELSIITEEKMTGLKKCTCDFHSVKDVHSRALCSYFIACLFKLKEEVN